MPQVPVVAPITLQQPANRDRVARELFGVVNYAALTPAFQTDLDKLEEDAFFEVTNLGKWYALTDPNFTGDPADFNLPSVFNELFRMSWLARGVRRFRSPKDGKEFWDAHVGPLFSRIADYFDVAPTGTVDDTQTVNVLRRRTIGTLVRQRPPVIPPYHESLRVIRDEFVKMWMERAWRFRVRHKKMTIDSANGDLLFPVGDPDIYAGIASKHLVIRTTDGMRYDIDWLDSERFAQAAAYYEGKTGRPKFFYDEDWGEATPGGTTAVLRWLPNPDKDYTVFGNILIAPPAFSADPNSAQGFIRLPVPLRAHLRARVIAAFVTEYGHENPTLGQALRAKVQMEAEALAPEWVYRGSHRFSARGHHQMEVIRHLTSYRGSPIIGQFE